MALNPELTAKVIAQLQLKWATHNCPMCRANDWLVFGHVTFTLGDTQGVLVAGGPYLPCAAVVCQNCGNTILVNLMALGAVPKGAKT